MKSITIHKQSGAVSLFVVIFFMLLITVVTVSFLRLMIADQQQASNNDLSQSAYDSAQAGVEDAKRALIQYQLNCANDPTNCDGKYANQIGSDVCNSALVNVLGMSTNGNDPVDPGEIKVQQSQNGNDTALDQAYTCVKIQLNTGDYTAPASVNHSQFIPLYSDQAYDRVYIQWFDKDDLSPSAVNKNLSLTGVNAAGQPLLSQGLWPVNRPPILRAQLIQYSGSFALNQFDTNSVAGGATETNSSSMFLYPTSQQGIDVLPLTSYDGRKTTTTTDPIPKDSLTTPTATSCLPDLNAGGYACTATILLPQAIGGSGNQRTAFLRLTPLYNSAHIRVTLWNGPILIDPLDPERKPMGAGASFKAVQPAIDSTGRANDVYRRVLTRVNLIDTSFPYPEEALDVTGDFCKDFAVTDTQYIASANTCKP